MASRKRFKQFNIFCASSRLIYIWQFIQLYSKTFLKRSQVDYSIISQEINIEYHSNIASNHIISLYSQGIQTGPFKHSKVNVKTTNHHKSRICVLPSNKEKTTKKDGWMDDRETTMLMIHFSRIMPLSQLSSNNLLST